MYKKIYKDCPTPKLACNVCKYNKSCNEMIAKGIFIDCKSFYYVFCWADKEDKVPLFDGNQEKFDAELDKYFEKRMQQPNLFIPKCTNGAFAAELALKFLWLTEDKHYDDIHNLYDLFYQLPEIHKVELADRIKKQAYQDDQTLKSQLKMFSNMFVKSRYFFEHKSFGSNGFFDNFVKIVCEYAFEVGKEIL